LARGICRGNRTVDANVGAHDQLHAARNRMTVDCRDHGLDGVARDEKQAFAAANQLQEARVPFVFRLPPAGDQRRCQAEIGAGAERLRSGAGQDGCTNGGRVAHFAPGVVEPDHHLRAHGVARLGTVDRDRCDEIADGEVDDGH
jgi:hypothetical protein